MKSSDTKVLRNAAQPVLRGEGHAAVIQLPFTQTGTDREPSRLAACRHDEIPRSSPGRISSQPAATGDRSRSGIWVTNPQAAPAVARDQSLFTSTRGARAAFSVLEIMVAVALLAIIIVGLLAMFYQVQRAFRAGTAQVDVMEGGRAAISLLMREMQEASATGLLGVTNLAIVPSWQDAPTSQTLSSGNVQQNFLSDLCFIQRRNDEWTGIAYRFTNAASGVGTLVRYSWSWTNVSNPLWMDGTNRMMSQAVCTRPADRYDGDSQIVDGVVHFQVEAYDSNGVLYRDYLDPLPQDDKLWFDEANDMFAFMSTNLPAYLDVELRVLEPATLAKFRARDFALATNYLARQIGRTHVFRQRIPLRSAALHAF